MSYKKRTEMKLSDEEENKQRKKEDKTEDE